MATGRLDIHSGVDRLLNYPGIGYLLGLPTRSDTCTLSTGVPTNGKAGFAPGCLFLNFRGSVGSLLYINTGSNTSTTWLDIA